MNIFPLLMHVHFLAFSHLRKSEVFCALLDFFHRLFAQKLSCLLGEACDLSHFIKTEALIL